MIAALALSALAADAPGPAIRWLDDTSGRTVAVEVSGIAPDFFDLAGAADRFAVRVDGASPGGPAMLGTYKVAGNVVRFEPRFPLDRGRRYRATYRVGASGPEVVSDHLVPRPARPRTVVTRVDPEGDRLPENLLKFYLHFSAPMARGEAYRRVRIIGDDGRPLELPFLELGEELWDPTGTRLTLLLDPGRIKKGLVPREEDGPILESGWSYTLEVASAWPDAEGEPLGEVHRKRFTVGPADEVQPEVATWKITAPAASSRGPLTISFPEPLDRALLESGLTLLDPAGEAVGGRVEIQNEATAWRFTPDEPWKDGAYALVVEEDLEDLAGNSLRRPFEVDITGPVTARRESGVVRLPISIR